MTHPLPVPAPFPEDDLLRYHGFAILRRVPGKPVLWRKGRLVFTQAAALIDIRKALARALDGGLQRRKR